MCQFSWSSQIRRADCLLIPIPLLRGAQASGYCVANSHLSAARTRKRSYPTPGVTSHKTPVAELESGLLYALTRLKIKLADNTGAVLPPKRGFTLRRNLEGEPSDDRKSCKAN